VTVRIIGTNNNIIVVIGAPSRIVVGGRAEPSRAELEAGEPVGGELANWLAGFPSRSPLASGLKLRARCNFLFNCNFR